jgi:uncharacterized membrane protein
MTITRVGPLSVAKVAGLLYVVIGLIAGCVLSLVAMVGGFAASAGDANVAGPLAALFGVGAIVILPIFYGVLGFIGSLIMAALFNVAAGMVGGIEVDAR